MNALVWAALSIAAVLLAERADNQPGRVILGLFACFLFVAGVCSAPWGGLLS
jgi:hypothetical protein